MEFHGCICPKDPKAGTKELTLTRWDPHGSREMIQRILPNKVPKSLPQTPMLTLYVGLKTFKKSQSFFFPYSFPVSIGSSAAVAVVAAEAVVSRSGRSQSQSDRSIGEGTAVGGRNWVDGAPNIPRYRIPVVVCIQTYLDNKNIYIYYIYILCIYI